MFLIDFHFLLFIGCNWLLLTCYIVNKDDYSQNKQNLINIMTIVILSKILQKTLQIALITEKHQNA